MKQKVTHEEMAALPYIIAVDFDGFLVEDKFPEIGKPNKEIVNLVKQRQDQGVKIILWTCRDGNALTDAILFCYYNLKFMPNAVNENLPEVQQLFNNDTRKVYANEYWDDKNVAFGAEWFANKTEIDKTIEHGKNLISGITADMNLNTEPITGAKFAIQNAINTFGIEDVKQGLAMIDEDTEYMYSKKATEQIVENAYGKLFNTDMDGPNCGY